MIGSRRRRARVQVWVAAALVVGERTGQPLLGTFTLAVTATNPCGEVVGSFPVEVSTGAMYRIYLPLVVRDSGQ